MVDSPALNGIGLGAIYLIQLFNLVEDGSLGGIVSSAELLAALEHQVFEIVCESGIVGRIVPSA